MPDLQTPAPTPKSRCSHPITLVPKCAHLNTGEIFTGKSIEKPCGSRLAERCEYCSGIYAADARSVFNGGVDSDPMLESHFTFVTLTAPGSQVFGKTHQRVTRTTGKGKSKKTFVLSRRAQPSEFTKQLERCHSGP